MSADNVGIKFDSALTIQVSDPKAAVRELGTVQGQPRSATSSTKQILKQRQIGRHNY